MEQNRKKDVLVTLAVLLVVVLVVGGAIAFNKKKNGTTGSANSMPVSTASDTTGTPATSQVAGDTTAAIPAKTAPQAYKDGTYTATSSYQTPENDEDITVTVTLQNGTVTGTSTSATARDRDSREYSNMFLESYKSLVVGKNIGDISLNHVSGSSLTSEGFNNAIQQIKSQAQS